MNVDGGSSNRETTPFGLAVGGGPKREATPVGLAGGGANREATPGDLDGIWELPCCPGTT